MTLGERVNALRKQKGWTQDDLAGKAGIGVATVQRIERGEPFSANTISSLAAAFGLSADEMTDPARRFEAPPPEADYLPLQPITSGKKLVDLVASAGGLDFDYSEIEDLEAADILGRLFAFCSPSEERRIPRDPAARIRLDIEAGTLLKELAAKRLTVSGETCNVTHHEVDDEGGSFAILLASWDETVLFLRIGTEGKHVDKADPYSAALKYSQVSDPKIVKAERPEQDSSDEPAF